MKNAQGNVLKDLEDVLTKWKEYITILYGDRKGYKQELEEEMEMEGLIILKEEVEKSIKEIKPLERMKFQSKWWRGWDLLVWK